MTEKIHLTLILPFLSRSKILFTESLTRHSFQLLAVRNHDTLETKLSSSAVEFGTN